MALAGRIAQVNTNHSAASQDLLLQTMVEKGLGLAVISEPYRILNNNCVGDLTGTVMALRINSDDSPGMRAIEKGQGYVAVAWGGLVVIGLYASPNVPVAGLQYLLDRVRNCIRRLAVGDILVLGDFNAKSTAWGSPRTNPRGQAVTEWAAELGLQLLNRGSTSTCVRWQGESIVDLSWASQSAARKVTGWRVAEELETLSDHRLIVLDFQVGGSQISGQDKEECRDKLPPATMDNQEDRSGPAQDIGTGNSVDGAAAGCSHAGRGKSRGMAAGRDDSDMQCSNAKSQTHEAECGVLVVTGPGREKERVHPCPKKISTPQEEEI